MKKPATATDLNSDVHQLAEYIGTLQAIHNAYGNPCTIAEVAEGLVGHSFSTYAPDDPNRSVRIAARVTPELAQLALALEQRLTGLA